MRLNEHALKFAAREKRSDKEGRLQYKSPKESYRQRWFKLKGNLLFYFRTNDMGHQSETEPLGMILLERCDARVQPFSDQPFVFSIELEGEVGRLHYFSCSTQQQCEEWVTAISTASIDILRAELMLLKSHIQRQTGRDPIDVFYQQRKQNKHFRRKSPSTESIPKSKSQFHHIPSTQNKYQSLQHTHMLQDSQKLHEHPTSGAAPGHPPRPPQRVPARSAPPLPSKPKQDPGPELPLLSFDDFTFHQLSINQVQSKPASNTLPPANADTLNTQQPFDPPVQGNNVTNAVHTNNAANIWDPFQSNTTMTPSDTGQPRAAMDGWEMFE